MAQFVVEINQIIEKSHKEQFILIPRQKHKLNGKNLSLEYDPVKLIKNKFPLLTVPKTTDLVHFDVSHSNECVGFDDPYFGNVDYDNILPVTLSKLMYKTLQDHFVGETPTFEWPVYKVLVIPDNYR